MNRLLAPTMLATLSVGLGGCPSQGDPADLPVLFEGMAYEDRCDGVEDSDGNFQEVAGALRAWGGWFEFVGEPDEDGTRDVRGFERLKVFGNSAWLEADPDNARAECEAVWTVTGSVSDDGAGDHQIAFSASYSDSDSTCAPGWGALAYENSWEDSYDVTLTCPDGGVCDAVFTWSESGNQLGTGHGAGDVVQYQAEAGCQFY